MRRPPNPLNPAKDESHAQEYPEEGALTAHDQESHELALDDQEDCERIEEGIVAQSDSQQQDRVSFLSEDLDEEEGSFARIKADGSQEEDGDQEDGDQEDGDQEDGDQEEDALAELDDKGIEQADFQEETRL